MKETGRKQLGALIVRDHHSKKSSREEANKSKNTPPTDIVDKKRSTYPRLDNNFELQKEFVKAENLTEEEQRKIRKDAEKAVGKRTKGTEIKIENDLIGLLEAECSKLGGEVEREKAESQKLRFQITQLRKNIDFLSHKLENMSQDKESLTKNNDYGKMEKDQLVRETQQLRRMLQHCQQQKRQQESEYQSQVESLRDQIALLNKQNMLLEAELRNTKEEKEEVEEEWEEKTRQYNEVREHYQTQKREWDRVRQELEAHTKNNLEKKGEKITKYQVQLQQLNDKLKEEEAVRKKVVEKNQELLKELAKKNDVRKQLEDQIVSMKKRINDLSILKSSNNTIMSQKVTQLSEQNSKLRKTVERLQSGKVREEESSKPFLFGPEDD